MSKQKSRTNTLLFAYPVLVVIFLVMTWRIEFWYGILSLIILFPIILFILGALYSIIQAISAKSDVERFFTFLFFLGAFSLLTGIVTTIGANFVFGGLVGAVKTPPYVNQTIIDRVYNHFMQSGLNFIIAGIMLVTGLAGYFFEQLRGCKKHESGGSS